MTQSWEGKIFRRPPSHEKLVLALAEEEPGVVVDLIEVGQRAGLSETDVYSAAAALVSTGILAQHFMPTGALTAEGRELARTIVEERKERERKMSAEQWHRIEMAKVEAAMAPQRAAAERKQKRRAYWSERLDKLAWGAAEKWLVVAGLAVFTGVVGVAGYYIGRGSNAPQAAPAATPATSATVIAQPLR